MRPILTAVLAGLCAAVVVQAPAHGQSQEREQVLEYRRDPLPTFDEAGMPAGLVKKSALPALPAEVVKRGPGNSVGVSIGGKIIFLRGLDVKLKGERECVAVASGTRAGGSAYSGANMGLGGSCQQQPAAK